MSSPNPVERIFEAILWKSRLVVLLAVISGVIGAFGLFVLGAVEIYNTIEQVVVSVTQHKSYAGILIGVIGAVDLFLIGIVLLIFSFGVYELFVSKLDEAHQHSGLKILEINSLDELKSKVLQVVLVVLIVTFFKVILSMEFKSPLEVLYFGLAIMAVSLAVFFLKKSPSEE